MCSVCYYVHYGSQPPQQCAVCGPEPALFEPNTVSAPPGAEAPEHWRCLNCGYHHSGSEPPAHCPVCTAAEDRFEPVSLEETNRPSAGDAQRVVIVGAGIAGLSAAAAWRKSASQSEICLISGEPCLPSPLVPLGNRGALDAFLTSQSHFLSST